MKLNCSQQKFYNLRIVSVEKFHEESVCHKVEGVQLRFVQIQHFQATFEDHLLKCQYLNDGKADFQ